MLLNRLYFRLKPLIPRPVRLGVRRWFALRKRSHVGNVWPILPGSERRPDGWPGWPEGKRFAFVLTHDVEGKQGVENCRKLALLEQNLGFRSSFNFVPEGSYTVPSALRFWLTNRGFEVGVHDLYHDGQLYSSWEEFSQKAQRINKVLKEWGAVGFRSGYMLSNLEWIKQLDIAYDASTFDTDPFEPQPDGVNTIFPFWVPRRSEVAGRSSEASSLNSQLSTLNDPRSGYVELPYTLPQDSTLFLMLREKTVELWTRKLDWIAAHGGMALLNVHPDYIRSGDTAISTHTYPVNFLRELLQYARQNYGDSMWHALPCEVAAWFAGKRALEVKTAFGQAVRPRLCPFEGQSR